MVKVSGSIRGLVKADCPDMNALKSVARSSMPTTDSPVI